MSTVLPENYGLVFGGLFSTVLANAYLVVNVIKARQKYGIKYPTLYADKSHIDGKTCKDEKDVEAYNSTQRAHQNTVENIATIQLFGAVNGLLFPRFSGACLLTYAVGRVIYGHGYAGGGPEGRKLGGLISHLGDIPLFLCTLYSAATCAGYA